LINWYNCDYECKYNSYNTKIKTEKILNNYSILDDDVINWLDLAIHNINWDWNSNGNNTINYKFDKSIKKYLISSITEYKLFSYNNVKHVEKDFWKFISYVYYIPKYNNENNKIENINDEEINYNDKVEEEIKNVSNYNNKVGGINDKDINEAEEEIKDINEAEEKIKDINDKYINCDKVEEEIKDIDNYDDKVEEEIKNEFNLRNLIYAENNVKERYELFKYLLHYKVQFEKFKLKLINDYENTISEIDLTELKYKMLYKRLWKICQKHTNSKLNKNNCKWIKNKFESEFEKYILKCTKIDISILIKIIYKHDLTILDDNLYLQIKNDFGIKFADDYIYDDENEMINTNSNKINNDKNKTINNDFFAEGFLKNERIIYNYKKLILSLKELLSNCIFSTDYDINCKMFEKYFVKIQLVDIDDLNVIKGIDNIITNSYIPPKVLRLKTKLIKYSFSSNYDKNYILNIVNNLDIFESIIIIADYLKINISKYKFDKSYVISKLDEIEKLRNPNDEFYKVYDYEYCEKYNNEIVKPKQYYNKVDNDYLNIKNIENKINHIYKYSDKDKFITNGLIFNWNGNKKLNSKYYYPYRTNESIDELNKLYTSKRKNKYIPNIIFESSMLLKDFSKEYSEEEIYNFKLNISDDDLKIINNIETAYDYAKFIYNLIARLRLQIPYNFDWLLYLQCVEVLDLIEYISGYRVMKFNK